VGRQQGKRGARGRKKKNKGTADKQGKE